MELYDAQMHVAQAQVILHPCCHCHAHIDCVPIQLALAKAQAEAADWKRFAYQLKHVGCTATSLNIY